MACKTGTPRVKIGEAVVKRAYFDLKMRGKEDIKKAFWDGRITNPKLAQKDSNNRNNPSLPVTGAFLFNIDKKVGYTAVCQVIGDPDFIMKSFHLDATTKPTIAEIRSNIKSTLHHLR